MIASHVITCSGARSCVSDVQGKSLSHYVFPPVADVDAALGSAGDAAALEVEDFLVTARRTISGGWSDGSDLVEVLD